MKFLSLELLPFLARSFFCCRCRIYQALSSEDVCFIFFHAAYQFVTLNILFSDKAPDYARYAKSVEEQPEGKAELIKCPMEE
jgi:hypothetical protein